jgi:hypothetical protein
MERFTVVAKRFVSRSAASRVGGDRGEDDADP